MGLAEEMRDEHGGRDGNARAQVRAASAACAGGEGSVWKAWV